MNHWKPIGAIDGAVTFDSAGAGPSFERVSVNANVHPSQDYPEARIAISIGGHCTTALTVEQSKELRAMLQQAESDVRAAVTL